MTSRFLTVSQFLGRDVASVVEYYTQEMEKYEWILSMTWTHLVMNNPTMRRVQVTVRNVFFNGVGGKCKIGWLIMTQKHFAGQDYHELERDYHAFVRREMVCVPEDQMHPHPEICVVNYGLNDFIQMRFKAQPLKYENEAHRRMHTQKRYFTMAIPEDYSEHYCRWLKRKLL